MLDHYINVIPPGHLMKHVPIHLLLVHERHMCTQALLIERAT